MNHLFNFWGLFKKISMFLTLIYTCIHGYVIFHNFDMLSGTMGDWHAQKHSSRVLQTVKKKEIIIYKR
jgi:hypothetical protein